MPKKLVNFRLSEDILRLLNALALDCKDKTEAVENAIRLAHDTKTKRDMCKDNVLPDALQK